MAQVIHVYSGIPTPSEALNDIKGVRISETLL